MKSTMTKKKHILFEILAYNGLRGLKSKNYYKIPGIEEIVFGLGVEHTIIIVLFCFDSLIVRL